MLEFSLDGNYVSLVMDSDNLFFMSFIYLWIYVIKISKWEIGYYGENIVAELVAWLWPTIKLRS